MFSTNIWMKKICCSSFFHLRAQKTAGAKAFFGSPAPAARKFFLLLCARAQFRSFSRPVTPRRLPALLCKALCSSPDPPPRPGKDPPPSARRSTPRSAPAHRGGGSGSFQTRWVPSLPRHSDSKRKDTFYPVRKGNNKNNRAIVAPPPPHKHSTVRIAKWHRQWKGVHRPSGSWLP